MALHKGYTAHARATDDDDSGDKHVYADYKSERSGSEQT